jgi:hypothetical protein
VKERGFQLGVFIFCAWRFYYNFVDVVPKWINDSYFVVESLLVVIFINSSNWNKDFRLVGLFGSIGSFLYFLLQYIDIFDFNPIGAKFFVPSIITLGIIIVGAKTWLYYR